MNFKLEYKYWQDIYWVILPILIGVVVYLGHKKKTHIMDWLNMPSIDRFGPLRRLSLILGIALIFLALLGPQKETGVVEVKGQGSDIYVLLDTSKSMLAEDVIPSRMERSKEIVKEIINNLDGDRIGFIPYASSAYIQMPLTDDYNLAKMYLEVVDTDMMGGGGTDVGQAIALAVDSFKNIGADNQVLLVLGDGEEADIDLKQVQKMIRDSGLTVFTVGIGTEEGSLIPMYDSDQAKVTAYKKDDKGELVVSKLDKTSLNTMATAGSGAFYVSDNGLSEVSKLVAEFSKLEKDETTRRKIKEYDQLFQWFLGVGMVLVILSLKLPKRRFDQ